jgi:solute carrier family 35 protein F5
MVVQFLYTDENFDSPFLLTYIGTTLFVVFLPSRLLWERRRRCCASSSSGADLDDEVIPWKTNGLYEHIPAQSSVPEDGFTIEPDSRRTKVMLLSHWQHLCIALKIAPVWFISNFAYNASLKYTSITSSTVLASTGSLFTFLFAIISRDERFSLVGFFGVMFGVVGSVLTGWSDVGNDSDNIPSNNTTSLHGAFVGTAPHFEAQSNPFEGHAMIGDFLGLLSALGYGTYTVMIRVLCPHDESS